MSARPGKNLARIEPQGFFLRFLIVRLVAALTSLETKIDPKLFFLGGHEQHTPARNYSEINSKKTFLEDRNLLKLRGLDFSCPLFLSDNSVWGQ